MTDIPTHGGIAPTPSARDLDWIRQALQSAIELECSTLPIYLAAMFSLKVQSNTAYGAIRSVAMEEMVHMAIASNILAAIGGSPKIAGIRFAFPATGLPGGVEPDLKVGPAKLSIPQLKNFMRIETPAFLVQQDRDETYPTIAAFYSEIQRAIKHNSDAIRAAMGAAGRSNQVDDNIGFRAIKRSPTDDPILQIYDGLDEILEQGEGACGGSMYAGSKSEDESSHYNRFAEIFYGASYLDPMPPIAMTLRNQAGFYAGRKIPFPEVVNTLAVPADGYARILALDPNAASVEADLVAFDQAFTSILTGLDACWNGPEAASWRTLGAAVHSMVDLRVLSCFNLLRHQIPPDVADQIPKLYRNESNYLAEYSDLHSPLFYGPRFRNTCINLF